MPVELTTPTTKAITGAELAQMGDIGPAELIEGRIVPMSPTGDEHAGIEVNIVTILQQFVRSHKLGKVRSGEIGIYTRRNPDTVRGADVLFISNERYAQKQSAGYLDVAPELVVEIMSPNDRWSNVMQKLSEYFDIGVRLVWIVDPKTASIYAYRSLTEVNAFAAGDILSADDILPGFSVAVEAILES
jgi:Uma2 family endonuclease